MEFDFVRSVGILVVVTALATVGLAGGNVMPPRIVFMMVLPSMVAFAVVSFVLGMKHGEFRSRQ
ncbi:MAG: hypothetical protein ABEJ61_02735 [Haloferacaceae archaeon]